MFSKMVNSALILFLFVGVVSAQMRMDPKERVKELSKRLNLTEKQIKQIEDIFTQQSEAMQELFASSGGDREFMRDEMMKLREETNKKVEKVLNEKQKVEYKKILEEQQARRQQQRPMGNR
jgi:Spy/CpxP family protein refolding chaperone